ncbi:MAG TPA: type II toxin-antitoxin system CcdA family antitoxin [Pseudonocardiaceae bacterium]|jgi:post-segregation antitoxin (ccd killing protein)|nr:type II toxin-antitoxin system CcdA family antitoxin [Pseudonocardiaceae bacterium]
MARLNVYLPDELAERVRAAHLNVSALTQAAVEAALARQATKTWLTEVAALPPVALKIEHSDVLAALDAVRDESESGDDA